MKKSKIIVWMIVASLCFGITSSQFFTGQSFADDTETIVFSAGNDAFSFVEGEALNNLLEDAEDFPSSYDLRHVSVEGGEVSYVTPVRLQNPYGTCWGFAAIAAVESSLLSSGLAQKKGYDADTLDLSEKQVSFFATSHVDDPMNSQYGEGTYFRNIPAEQEGSYAYRYNTGGMSYMATLLFASGMGPAFEADDPLLEYRGTRGEMAYWEAATQYDDEGNPVEDSYQNVPVWYSDQDDWYIPEEYRYMQDYRIRDSIVLPSPAEYTVSGEYEYHPEAVEAIKQQIAEYNRAVSINFCAESYLPGQDTTGKLYMSDKWAHFTNVYEQPNHTVTIVGYDDNYPKENFDSTTENGGSAQPEGNGAFLIKNSWGSELNEFPTNGYRHWGLLDGQDGSPYDPEAQPNPGNRASGYFWISYYDRSLNDPEAFVFEDLPEEDFCYTEQMDYMHAMDVGCARAQDSLMANIFTAEATSRLSEISVMTQIPGTTVSYSIYLLGEGAEDPEDGILIDRGEAYCDYGGYHRIDLNHPAVLTKGQKYSVVIRETAEDMDYITVALDSKDDGLSEMYSVAVINPGESFFFDGSEWIDESSDEAQAMLTGGALTIDNFPIKSYLYPINDPDGEIFNGYLTIHNWQEDNPGTFSVMPGESKTLTAEFRGISSYMPATWDPSFTWKTSDESILKIDTATPKKGNAVITGIKPGTTNLIVYAGDANTGSARGFSTTTASEY